MIEDAKLRELFKVESEEHLQQLDDALLLLEKNPADQNLLEEAFREAHSMKGAARMLGLAAVQAPAHRLEDELNAARRGIQALDASRIERMSIQLAELRRLTFEALAAPGPIHRAATTPQRIFAKPAAAPRT